MHSCGELGLLSKLQRMGFSLQWFLLLLIAGSRAHGLGSCSSRALEHRLSRGFPGGSVVKIPPGDAGDRSLCVYICVCVCVCVCVYICIYIYIYIYVYI